MGDSACKDKKPISDKKIAANRANSKKSTGPRSEAGKATASRNSLRHGMRSKGDILPGELDKKVKETIGQWENQLRPEGFVEITLVRQAVVCSAKLEWLDKNFNAVVTKQARAAGNRFDSRARKAILLEAETLATDPKGTIDTLKHSSAGYDWLIAEWNILIEALPNGWDEPQANHALNLLGIDPTQDLDDAALSIKSLIDASRGLSAPVEGEEPHDLDAIRAVIQSLIDNTVADLTTKGDEQFAAVDLGLRQEAQASAMIPLGKNGSLWPRYQGMSAKGFHQAIHDLIKIRKLDDPQRPNDFRRPLPDAPNEPNGSPQTRNSYSGSDNRGDAFAEALKASKRENEEQARMIEQLKMKLIVSEKAMNGMEMRFEAQCRRSSEAPNEANEATQTTVKYKASAKNPSAMQQVFKVAAILLAIFLAAGTQVLQNEEGIGAEAGERSEVKQDGNSHSEKFRSEEEKAEGKNALKFDHFRREKEERVSRR